MPNAGVLGLDLARGHGQAARASASADLVDVLAELVVAEAVDRAHAVEADGIEDRAGDRDLGRAWRSRFFTLKRRTKAGMPESSGSSGMNGLKASSRDLERAAWLSDSSIPANGYSPLKRAFSMRGRPGT